MKPAFILLFFLLHTLAVSAQVRSVVIHCDVLGKKDETVRYYHPVEGRYDIELHYFPHYKKSEHIFQNCAFINPWLYLKDSVTHIQANSLRHYIDPSELIYVEWKTGNGSPNQKKLDQLKCESKDPANRKYQKAIENYFKPFYISKYEVTNGEYREFVNWVRDSLMKETIYFSGEFDDEEMKNMLNIKEDQVYYSEPDLEWKYASDMSLEECRSYFSFKQDFDIWEEFAHEDLYRILEYFYIRPGERYYARHEFDVRTFNFTYYWVDHASYNEAIKKDSVREQQTNAIRHHTDRTPFIHKKVINVYPDTISWLKDASYLGNAPIVNMYFWHPAFDDYPVVGVSHEQALAYLNWKQQVMISQEDPLYSYLEFDLPTVYEYEWAISHQVAETDKVLLQDNEIVPTLLTGQRDGATGKFHESLQKLERGLTEKVWKPYHADDQKEHRKFLTVLKKEYYPMEAARHLETHLAMRYTQNILPGDIEFLSNNVSEWMSENYKDNYEKLFEAYINYNCFANPEYCEDQRNIDIRHEMRNDEAGYLIIGGNWYDERYENLLGVNVGGLYPKTFRDGDSAFSTVGFRYVIRLREQYDY